MLDYYEKYRYRYSSYRDDMRMIGPPVLSGPQTEKQKRKEGKTCPMPKSHNRFPRK